MFEIYVYILIYLYIAQIMARKRLARIGMGDMSTRSARLAARAVYEVPGHVEAQLIHVILISCIFYINI